MRTRAFSFFLFPCSLLLLFVTGCTSRGLTVTSEPPGAEVSVNRRVVGQTPVRVGFTHYGTYRIELRKKGFETLVREEPIKPPIYGYDPVAAVADNVIPARLNDEAYLHYVLKPLEQKSDRAALLERAELARSGTITNLKTNEQLTINLGREPASGPPEEAAAANAKPLPPVATAAPDAETAQGPAAPKPEGLRLAEEYDIKPLPTAPDKRASFARDEGKKPAAPAVFRVPKEEELLYDEPAAPAEKDAKKKAEKKAE